MTPPIIVEELSDLKQAFLERNGIALKDLAKKFSNQALEHNDRQFVKLSIVCFAVAKLMEKPYIINSGQWKKFANNFTQHIDEAKTCEISSENCAESLDQIMKDVNSLSTTLGRFVMGTIEKAQIKTATEIYAHGASIGSAVELTGADRMELLSYISATKLPEQYQSKTVKERIKFGNKLFA